MLGDIWSGNHIRTFKDLQIRYFLHNTQFYRYLQLRHALQSHITDGSSLPEYSPPEAQTLTGNLGKGGISCIYRSLVNNTPNALSRLRDKWEGWLGSLDDTDWGDELMTPRTITASARLSLVQIYYLHAVYLTPLCLQRAGLSPEASCPRCDHPQADYYTWYGVVRWSRATGNL